MPWELKKTREREDEQSARGASGGELMKCLL